MATAQEIQELPFSAEEQAAGIVTAVDGFFWRLSHPADASFRLGCNLVRDGRFQQAKFRFKFTLWRQPHRASAWYNLGICHLALNEKAEGIAALKRAIALNSKNEQALFMLATIDGGRYAEGHQPHTTPVDLIKSEFLARADTYEEEEVENGYRCHFSLFEVAQELLGQQPAFDTVLDAGCGTGLLGELLRPLSKRLKGIDLSAGMLAQARAKITERQTPLYNELLEGDLRAHLLHTSSPTYDLITACNVAPIMGGLAPMVDGAARSLKPGGWIIFNVTLLENQPGYKLQLEDRRFAHSENYLQQLAQKSSLALMPLTQKPLNTSRETWIVRMQKPS